MTNSQKLTRIKELITEFDATCSQEEYTDTGEAWDLFYGIISLIDSNSQDDHV